MRVYGLLLIGVLLAACGGEASAATLKGTVTYSKSGGIAGLGQELRVQKDGRAVASSYEDKRSFKLSRAQLKSLTTAVTKADLAHTKSPKSTGDGADGFEYGVSYRGHRVHWSDFTDDPPQRVRRLYDLLDELYERYSPCPTTGRSC